MSTHAADSAADVGVDSTTLAALSLSAASDQGSQSPVTSTGDQQLNTASGSKETSGNIGASKRNIYRQKNQSQYYRPRRDPPGPGFTPSGNYSSERGRYPRRNFGRGARPGGYSFPTPLDQTGQGSSAQPAPNSATSGHKFITKRRPPPRPENIKPNDVFISLKTNYKAHCEKCKKLLDGKFSEINLYALLDAIPLAINVAIELRKYFQGTVDFTTRTETVNLIDDLIPVDDSTAPSFARRKVSSINIRLQFKMLFTWEEVSKWLGVTAYEITLYLLSFVIFSIGLALKVDTKFGEDWSWWSVFAPLFIGDALNAYFIIIVFLRMYLEKKIKIAFWRIAWSLIQLILKFLFELLICWKLVDQSMFNYSEVMAPMFILSLFVMIRALYLLSENPKMNSPSPASSVSARPMRRERARTKRKSSPEPSH